MIPFQTDRGDTFAVPSGTHAGFPSYAGGAEYRARDINNSYNQKKTKGAFNGEMIIFQAVSFPNSSENAEIIS